MNINIPFQVIIKYLQWLNCLCLKLVIILRKNFSLIGNVVFEIQVKDTVN